MSPRYWPPPNNTRRFSPSYFCSAEGLVTNEREVLCRSGTVRYDRTRQKYFDKNRDVKAANKHTKPMRTRNAFSSFLCVITATVVLLYLATQAEGMPAPPKKTRGNRYEKKKVKSGKVDEVVCEACKAITVEAGPKIEPLVKKLGRENAVTEVLDSFCDSYDNFRTYNHIPPKMQEGCRKVLGASSELFEKLFYDKVDAMEIWSEVCQEHHCKGIPFDQKREGPNVQTVTVDGDAKAEL